GRGGGQTELRSAGAGDEPSRRLRRRLNTAALHCSVYPKQTAPARQRWAERPLTASSSADGPGLAPLQISASPAESPSPAPPCGWYPTGGWRETPAAPCPGFAPPCSATA